MKRTLTCILYLAMALCLLTGCGKNSEKAIEGVWRVTAWEYPAGEGIEAIDDFMGSIGAFLDTGMMTWTYTFKDGTFLSEMSMMGVTEPRTGTYTVEGNRLFLYADDGDESYTFTLNGADLTLVESSAGLITRLVKQ